VSGLERELTRAAARLCDEAARAGWRGSDPYDGLWWRWPRAVVGGKRRRQAVAQLHARAPLDVRRLRRGERPPIPKALGAFGGVAARLGLEHAVAALDELDRTRDAGPHAWGYHWDVQTRWTFYPACTPNVVVTAFAARGLEEGGRVLGEERFVSRARRAARWVLDELYVPEGGYFAYHPRSAALVHNASLLGARLAGSGEEAARAVERTLAVQRPDGSWPYGEGPGLGFVDSFHTGYVLSALLELRRLHPGVDAAIETGARYYADTFFDERGRPLLWPGRSYPEDGHSAGTALTTLSALERAGFGYSELRDRVARRVLDAMIVGGRGVHRRHRFGRTTVRYLRWCDAHLALGLADAAGAGLASPDAGEEVPGAHAGG
jgi:hypothetical protein